MSNDNGHKAGNGKATVVGSIIFGIVAVGALIQIQIGNVSSDTRQANVALRNELEAKMDSIKARTTILEALNVRIRATENQQQGLIEHQESHDKDLTNLDSKLQIELQKLDEKLQLEIDFTEKTVKGLEAQIERVRQALLSHPRSKHLLIP